MVKDYCLVHYSCEKPFSKFPFDERTIFHSCRVEILPCTGSERGQPQSESTSLLPKRKVSFDNISNMKDSTNDTIKMRASPPCTGVRAQQFAKRVA